jgi:flagellar motor switch protein FliG
MKIQVKKTDEHRYHVVLDSHGTDMSLEDMERLHHMLTDILRPETAHEKRTRHQAFLSSLRTADDTGIQTLLRAASHDDILVLLHSSEEDQDLQNRLYGNMTENSLKMYLEDLLFQFREGVPDYRFDEAMTRLIKTAESLVKDGKLRFS